MNYTLMHKDREVIDLEIDEVTLFVAKLGDIHDADRLPLGLSQNDWDDLRFSLNKWWLDRAIPASRQKLQEALDILQIQTTGELLMRSYGLSLSDQYWVRNNSQGLRWQDINFFDNDFSDDVGQALFGHGSSDKEVSLMSPNNASEGWLQKKWTIADGKRVLVKAGSAAFYQEPLNELVAAMVASRLQIPHVDYELGFEDGRPLSICPDFVTTQTDLISAYAVLSEFPLPEDENKPRLPYMLEAAENLGIPDVRRSLDQMMVLDFLIANQDRHFRNFGFLRDADDLHWLGMAPIFDNGTSLWYDRITADVDATAPGPSKPFAKTHEAQLKLVSDFSWLDLGRLDGAVEETEAILSRSRFIDTDRRHALCHAFAGRIELLREYLATA